MAVPKIAPIAAGPAPPRNARARGFWRIAVEVPGASEDEGERGREGYERRQQAAAEAGSGVTDHRDRLYNRTGSDLTERDRVQKLPIGHPVVVVHRVGLHQRDDDEPAAVGQRTDLERHPAKGEQPAGGRSGRGENRKRSHRSGDRPAPVEARDELDQPAAQQHEHQPGSERRRRDATRGQIDGETERADPPAPAIGKQRACRLHGNGGHGSAGSGGGAERPAWRRRREKEP